MRTLEWQSSLKSVSLPDSLIIAPTLSEKTVAQSGLDNSPGPSNPAVQLNPDLPRGLWGSQVRATSPKTRGWALGGGWQFHSGIFTCP